MMPPESAGIEKSLDKLDKQGAKRALVHMGSQYLNCMLNELKQLQREVSAARKPFAGSDASILKCPCVQQHEV